ncbi:MAG TPA: hypothetical protein VK094_00290 [Pseudogracilibacillus sp.]|nr:hypothetical protein [Pseudogracilibacillus sp.]
MKKQPKYIIKHVIHPRRRGKKTGVLKPVIASNYYKYLSKIGAGF